MTCQGYQSFMWWQKMDGRCHLRAVGCSAEPNQRWQSSWFHLFLLVALVGENNHLCKRRKEERFKNTGRACSSLNGENTPDFVTFVHCQLLQLSQRVNGEYKATRLWCFRRLVYLWFFFLVRRIGRSNIAVIGFYATHVRSSHLFFTDDFM